MQAKRLVADLLNRGVMRATDGPWLHWPIDDRPREWPRVEGMLLGLAIGDALGNTTEGRGWAEREEVYGEIRDYLPNAGRRGPPNCVPSDDTQLAVWTLGASAPRAPSNPKRLPKPAWRAGQLHSGIGGKRGKNFQGNPSGGAPI